jgi:ABC-type dipeptide/oligopeptide/nickel transport system permease subunit
METIILMTTFWKWAIPILIVLGLFVLFIIFFIKELKDIFDQINFDL